MIYQKLNTLLCSFKVTSQIFCDGFPKKKLINLPKVIKYTHTSIICLSLQVLQDLQNRLSTHIPFHPPLEGAKQNYGIDTNLLNTIVEFWKTKYNWREREKFLNQFPQYKVNIQGLNIHYIHVKPKETKGVKVRPLLLVHGWPGSVREFYEIIPILTTPRDGLVFEVIVPSLPGKLLRRNETTLVLISYKII